MLRLLEPPGSSREKLLERLYSGTYDRPFVVDNGRRRFLHFDFNAIQSAMEMRDPLELALPYTRKMMAFLLFNPDPKRILLLGLGGGSLAKYCHGKLPHASLTAVEVNRDVISLRGEFAIPGDDHRFRVVNCNGAAYISATRRLEDVILSDACDRNGIVSDLDSVDFYRRVRRRLSTGGVFVANICGTRAFTSGQLARIREGFDGEVLTLPVRNNGNVIAFGFRNRCPDFRGRRFGLMARELRQQFRLDFPGFARRIVRPR